VRQHPIKISIAISLFFLLTVGLYTGFTIGNFALRPASSEVKESILLQVTPGTRPRRISQTLHEKGVIKNAQLFYWMGRGLKKWGQLKVGEYELSAQMTPLQVYDILTSGVSVGYRFTIVEGDNMYQVASALDRNGFGDEKKFLELFQNPEFMKELGFEDPLPVSLEGYLFPETYSLPRSMSEKDITRTLYRNFQRNWNDKKLARAKALGLSKHEVITLASIVEKETGAPWERPVISSVFHNRLKKRMRLQSDPTTIYGMWERYDGRIRRSDLNERTAYNTYQIPRLPPGPIANPGLAAIQATLDPDETEYLFFVSQNDGTHIFSKTYAEHKQAVDKYQRDPRMREGRSWRELQERLDKEKKSGDSTE
jgi:UPF0755 protein